MPRKSQKSEIDYPSLTDRLGIVMFTYSATRFPTLVLIDAQGVVRDVVVGAQLNDLERMQSSIAGLLPAE